MKIRKDMLLDISWDALLRPWASNRYFDLPCPPMFETYSQDCNLNNAWWCSELSRLIYRQNPDEIPTHASFPTRSEILQSAGLREIETFSTGTSFCSLVESGNNHTQSFAALVFRGTRGFEGWLSNLKTSRKYWPTGGSVHGGFKSDFLMLWQKIEPSLFKIDLPLYFTGHSLGGAQAILAASMHPARAVYTFGAPKTGDSVFADSLKDTRIYRFENNRDIIPSVPPSTIPFDFCHAGISICLKDERRSSIESNNSRGLTHPPEFLSDHAPVNYSIRLENALFQS